MNNGHNMDNGHEREPIYFIHGLDEGGNALAVDINEIVFRGEKTIFTVHVTTERGPAGDTYFANVEAILEPANTSEVDMHLTVVSRDTREPWGALDAADGIVIEEVFRGIAYIIARVLGGDTSDTSMVLQ